MSVDCWVMLAQILPLNVYVTGMSILYVVCSNIMLKKHCSGLCTYEYEVCLHLSSLFH
jgi:hypothetical protein